MTTLTVALRVNGVPTTGHVRATPLVAKGVLVDSGALNVEGYPLTLSQSGGTTGQGTLTFPANLHPDVLWTFTITWDAAKRNGQPRTETFGPYSLTQIDDAADLMNLIGTEPVEVDPYVAESAAATATAARDAAVTALDQTTDARDTVLAFGNTQDTLVAAFVGDPGSATAAATAAATAYAARQARLDGMLRAATLGEVSGSSVLWHRHADDVRIIRPLAQGYAAEYFFRRVTATAVGTKSLVFTATAIGRPMTAVEPTVGAGTVTYTGTWLVTGSNAGNTKLEPWEGFPLTRDTATLSWTGTGSMTASPALNPSAASSWISRWVTIPGQGAGGVDAFVRITNVTGSGATVAFSSAGGVAPAAAFSNVVSTIDPLKRQTNTAGDYVEHVTPTATRVGVVLGVAATCGLVAVTVDGDATAANLLPTAQQLVDDGRLAASALTSGGGTIAPTARILDPYGPVTQWGVCFAVADGLTATTHTVRYTLLAAKNPAASTTVNLLGVAGFGYSNGDPSLTDTSVEIFSTYRVGRFASNNELAIDTSFSGGSAAFVGGEGHGYEGQTQAPSYTVNGALITPAARTKHAGSSIVIHRKADVFHPADQVNPSWRYETTYRIDAQPGLGITQRATAARALTIASAGYLHNWDVYLTKTQGSAEDVSWESIGVADGTYLNGGKHDALAFWDARLGSGAVAVLYVPDAKRQTGGWSSTQKVVTRKLQGGPVGGASVGYPHLKGYVQIPPGAYVAGQVISGEGRYIVGRDPGLSPQFPATAAL